MHKSYVFKSSNGKIKLHTSNTEIKDLLISWLMISLAFAIAITSSKGLSLESIINTSFLVSMAVSAITVGIGFLLHELAHKVVAQKYKCWAEFRSDFKMLIFGVLLSVTGIIFMAPGAVIIYGNITKKQHGKISMAGPLVNIAIALLMLPLLFVNFSNPLLTLIVTFGYRINAFIALFNMIPFFHFDGAKIYALNKPIYFIMVAIASFLIFLYSMLTI